MDESTLGGPSSEPVAAILGAWQRERPDVDAASIEVITPLWRISRAVIAGRQRTLAAYDLDQSGLDVLGTLRRSGEPYRLTATELSVRCGVTPGATTQRVARLEASGLVRRSREEPDRRTVHVELAAAGHTLLDEVFAQVMAADEAMLDGMSSRDRATLVRILGAWEQRL
ncbi:MarR family winged helix-turn-helix transcriptional regulator [Luteipulveratus halotolerans]|uniref:HTH marR-type domain-containing protein n=1 Tax=Luteipulveratus halotolerans TaxID=1631356 RepID=A0A0L6CNS5_9MICO|nr:MarR family transcriptional regulator [Luteipulveratus halotolerans]KNX39300.1 hypothetical protein VV01_07975 [Luteipulveratus halotolerans]